MKKVIVTILTMMLVFSVVLTGCGGNSANPNPTGTPTPSNTATPEPDKDFSGKYTPTLTVNYARGAGLDVKFPEGVNYENNIWIQEFEEILGIKVNTLWTAEGVDAYDTKLNMSIASGELPDVFKCNPGQLQRLVEAGLVESLDASIEKYASEQVKAMLQVDGGEALRQSTYGGSIMALPENSVVPANYEFVFIRDDWREALNLPVPKTLSDLYALAEAFKTRDPDGNGQADTYGIGISNKPYESYFAMKGLFNGYGAYPDQWIEKDGQLVYGSIQPEMKNALTALKKLYDDKLIDPEFIVKDSYKVSQDAVGGKVGIGYGQFWVQTWPLPDGYKADGADWTAYPIVHDSSVQDKGVSATSKLTAMYAVKKGFSNPEALVKMYGHFLDRVFGGESDLSKYKNDGEYNIMGWSPVVTYIGPDRNLAINEVVTKAVNDKNEGLLEDLEQKGIFDSINKFNAGDKDSAYWVHTQLYYGTESVFGIANQYMKNGQLKPNLFYGADTPEMVRRMSILKASEEEMILRIITGDQPVDYFDEFVANWNKLGGETITFEVNQWRESTK